MNRSLLMAAILVAVALAVGGGVLADRADADAARTSPDVFVDVLIAFDAAPGAAEQALVRGFGGQVRHTFTLVPAIAASVPQQAVAALLHHPRITAVEPDGVVHLLDHTTTVGDAELNAAWGVKHIGAGPVHLGNQGAGVKVAVIDTGIDYLHADLDGNYKGGYDFVNGDGDPMDDHGHGTHVSGTIAGEDDGAGVVGVAPAAELYGLKVLSASGSGAWSGVIAALEWATTHGIQVANLSLGSSSDPGSTVHLAFDNAAASGLVIVAAAGNSGNPKGKGDKVIYPARYDSVIAVASTTASDARSRFSSTGPAVEIAAPGSSVYSTLLGGGYGTKSGTSMASPHVAGTAALIIASGISDPAAVRTQLQVTADDLGAAGRDNLYGFGLVDADEAAGPAVAAPPSPPTITSFTASPNPTDAAEDPTTLAWTTSNAVSVAIDQGVGTVQSPDGDVLLNPTATTTYTLTASGPGGEASAQLTVTVGPPPPVGDVKVSIGYSWHGGPAGTKHLTSVVTIRDGITDAPVEGVTVLATLVRMSDDASWPFGGATAAAGSVAFKLIGAGNSMNCYKLTVTSVAGTAMNVIGDTECRP